MSRGRLLLCSFLSQSKDHLCFWGKYELIQVTMDDLFANGLRIIWPNILLGMISYIFKRLIHAEFPKQRNVFTKECWTSYISSTVLINYLIKSAQFFFESCYCFSWLVYFGNNSMVNSVIILNINYTLVILKKCMTLSICSFPSADDRFNIWM